RIRQMRMYWKKSLRSCLRRICPAGTESSGKNSTPLKLRKEKLRKKKQRQPDRTEMSRQKKKLKQMDQRIIRKIRFRRRLNFLRQILPRESARKLQQEFSLPVP